MTDNECTYDYANKCDCSEDDKCGCTFPNNMPHDFDCPQAIKAAEKDSEISQSKQQDLNDSQSNFSQEDYKQDNLLPEDSSLISLEEYQTSPLLVGKLAPDFTAEAVMGDNHFKLDFNLYEYLEGSYGFIFFYPADFTFVCPSELLAYNQKLQDFTNRNVKIIAISVDSKYAHQTWKKIPFNDGGIGDINFPMIADITKAVTYQYGALKNDGTAMRASYLIDKNKVVRYLTVTDDKIGRDPQETLRIIDALQFVEAHGDVCPAGWHQGDRSLRPSPDGVAEYIKDFHHQEQ